MGRGSFAATASLLLFTTHLAAARPTAGGSGSGGPTAEDEAPAADEPEAPTKAAPATHVAVRVTMRPEERKALSRSLLGFVTFGLFAGACLFAFGRRAPRDEDDGPPSDGAPPRITFVPRVTLDPLKGHDPAITFQSIEARIHGVSEILREAWCAGDMRAARPFVSDGMYGRYQVQLALKRGLGRRDVMRDALVVDAELEEVEAEAPLDVVHVRIQGRAREAEVALDAPPEEIERALEHAELVRYEEIWSLVRRRGATTRPDASVFARNCASCGAAIQDARGGSLPTATEMITCRYCGALLCSGERDWVLAEITRPAVWHRAWPEPQGLGAFRAVDPELSRAALEDRASHLFWRWIEAGRVASASPLRKCATPHFLASRLRLEATGDLRDVVQGGVDLVAVERGELDVARVQVFWSAVTSASMKEGVAPSSMKSLLRLVRKRGITAPASMTTLACRRCGAGIGESDAPTCDHCGALLAEGDDAWVLDGIESTRALLGGVERDPRIEKRQT